MLLKNGIKFGVHHSLSESLKTKAGSRMLMDVMLPNGYFRKNFLTIRLEIDNRGRNLRKIFTDLSIIIETGICAVNEFIIVYQNLNLHDRKVIIYPNVRLY